MSVKRKIFSAYFKAKLVLEVLKEDQSVNKIASKYEVLPKSLKDWKISALHFKETFYFVKPLF